MTIGQENRGGRKGTPIIGNEVWIGVNATIVGAIHIGNDVLIAPNTYVNCDIPDHSIVFGNPCIIKPRQCATEGYINNKVECIFRKNRALAPHERSAVPLGTDHCPVC